jgi:hypothetical protein
MSVHQIETLGAKSCSIIILKIDGLKLTMMTVCNSNGEITFNID